MQQPASAGYLIIAVNNYNSIQAIFPRAANNLRHHSLAAKSVVQLTFL